MERYTLGEFKKLSSYIRENGLNAEVRIATPSLSENYLVNIIGGRHLISVPDSGRKCTSMLKIQPIQRLKRRLAQQLGLKRSAARDSFISLTGMRWDESDVRGRNMDTRGEKPNIPVKVSNPNNPGDYQWMLSPLYYWSLDDVYMLAAECTNHLRKSYSDLAQMLTLYRAANAGECLINIEKGKLSPKAACGSRHGCHQCCQVSDDKSMRSMLQDDRYTYMEPLNHLRNLMKAFHYDLSKRSFLARSINPDGTVHIAPNAYSPEYCQQLLRWVLTIQIREEEASDHLGIAPRFRLLEREDVLGISFLWNRYGYALGFEALKIWRDIYVYGHRFDMPRIPINPATSLPSTRRMDLPFSDNGFSHFTSGVHDIEYAQTGADIPNQPLPEDAFSINHEGCELLFEFELDNTIERFNDPDVNPTASVHYLIRLGIVKIAKGKQHLLEATLQIANQLWRHQLREYLNDPQELINRLGRLAPALPSQGQQFDVDDCIRILSFTENAH